MKHKMIFITSFAIIIAIITLNLKSTEAPIEANEQYPDTTTESLGELIKAFNPTEEIQAQTQDSLM